MANERTQLALVGAGTPVYGVALVVYGNSRGVLLGIATLVLIVIG